MGLRKTGVPHRTRAPCQNLGISGRRQARELHYSIWAKHRIPSARLVLLEPDPRNLAVGRHNLELNGMDGIFVQAAIGSEHETQLMLSWESDNQPHLTRQVSVDGLMRDLALDRIDLLLADVQRGRDRDAAWLRRCARRTADPVPGSVDPPPQHLRRPAHAPALPPHSARCRARLVAEHSVAESCSGDGLIGAAMLPEDRDLRAGVTIVRARDTVFGELEWSLRAPSARRSRNRLDAVALNSRDCAEPRFPELLQLLLEILDPLAILDLEPPFVRHLHHGGDRQYPHAKITDSAGAMTTQAPTASQATRTLHATRAWFESRRHQTIAALALYAAIAIGYFGLHVLPHLGSVCVCEPSGTDPSFDMWSLAWWPHALLHGLNPFFTTAVFAPDRVDIGGAATVPAAALALAPVSSCSARSSPITC